MTLTDPIGPSRSSSVDRVAPSVTVVVPVYDESQQLERVVAEIDRELGAASWDYRILVLNDGSNDWSADLERGLLAHESVRLESFYPNQGKGAVLNRAFPMLDTDLAVVIDADGEYAASEIDRVLQPLADDRGDWVMGARYGFGRRRPRQYLTTYLVNRLINTWFFLLSGLRFKDLLTGLYAFRTELVSDIELREKRFSYSAELVWKLLRTRSLRWSEVPITYRFRSYAEGKKIRWWETGTLLLALVRYRFLTGRKRPRRVRQPASGEIPRRLRAESGSE